MARVKRGTTSLKTRRKVLKRAKGFRLGKSTKERQAREVLLHAGNFAFAHRRRKKRDFRKLWQVRVNAALRERGLTFSKFMGTLHKKNIAINRKMLADIAQNNPDTFDRVVEQTK